MLTWLYLYFVPAWKASSCLSHIASCHFRTSVAICLCPPFLLDHYGHTASPSFNADAQLGPVYFQLLPPTAACSYILALLLKQCHKMPCAPKWRCAEVLVLSALWGEVKMQRALAKNYHSRNIHEAITKQITPKTSSNIATKTRSPDFQESWRPSTPWVVGLHCEELHWTLFPRMPCLWIGDCEPVDSKINQNSEEALPRSEDFFHI